jgi:hypothetical protein
MFGTMRRIAVITLFAVFPLALGACEDGHTHEQCEMPTVSVEADPTTIVSGEDVTLTVTVENFTLMDPEAHDHGDERPDDTQFRHGYDGACEGHYHVYLDDLMTNPLMMAWEEEVTVTVDADAGEHELFVRLNDPDHKIIQPEVVDSVAITVNAP